MACVSLLVGLCMGLGGGLVQGSEEGGKIGDGGNSGHGLPRDIEVGAGRLDLGAKLRMRYEWFNNYNLKTYGTNTSDQVLGEKLWIDAGYRIGENALFFLRLQDAHFWLSDFDAGDFAPACSYENPLDILQAYAELHRIGGTPVGVKAGRQRILYADQRVWGPGDWSNSGKFTWDSVKLLWEGELFSVDGLYGRRVIADPDKLDADYYPYETWSAYARVKKLPFDLDLFYVLKNDPHKKTAGESGTNSLALHAVGSRLFWKPVKGAELGGTVIREFGDWGDDGMDAWAGVISAGYTGAEGWKPGIKASYAYASGDSDPKDGKHETFDMLYGSASAYYGFMNLLGWMNLHDYQLDVSAKPKGLDKAVVSYHYFQMDEAKDAWYYCSEKAVRRDKTGKSGTDLGQEVDVVLGRKIDSNLAVDVAFCHFFAGEFAEATGKGKDADWAYVMTTITF